jgi:hypothetical protein
VRCSARIGRSKARGPVERWLCDRLMPLALKRVASPQADAWKYAHHVDRDEPVVSAASAA